VYRDPDSPESHKNEGFLKSIWHNLTNHPAHQAQPKDTPEAKADSADGSAKKDESEKKDDGAQKASGSGSG
jgi:molecular chaperone DnaJ